jgi:phosphonate transport system substrate-binding protein
MNNRKGLLKVLAVLLALVTLSLFTAACGDDDESSEQNTTKSEQNTTKPDNGWPSKITFGAVPAEAASSLEADYEHTRAILISEIEGLEEIDFFQATEYAGIIEGIIAGRIDVGQFGGFSYVIATNNGADVDVAGVMTRDPEVEPGYRSYLVTHPDSGITSIEQLADKTVCFVDPGSTSGFLFPSEGMLSAGLDPSETSTDIVPVFAGGHDASAITVANGECDAGFAYDSMVTSQLIDSGDIKGVIDDVEDENVNPEDADLRIIWKSQTISGAPMAISNDLPADFIARWKEVLNENVNVPWAIENGFCEGTLEDNTCSFADEDDTWGYVPKTDAFYDGIRQVCEVTKASKCG